MFDTPPPKEMLSCSAKLGGGGDSDLCATPYDTKVPGKRFLDSTSAVLPSTLSDTGTGINCYKIPVPERRWLVLLSDALDGLQQQADAQAKS